MLFIELSWSRMLERKWGLLLLPCPVAYALELVPSTMSPVVVIPDKTSLQLIEPAYCRRNGLPTSSIDSGGAATPPHKRRLFSWHGRVARRDTTVPNSTWHGVSGRGASEACLPKPLAQYRPAMPQ